jgi:hypothetical protein
MRDKQADKTLSTFKGFLNKSIRPSFKDIIQKRLGAAPWVWVNLQGN